MIHWLTCEGRTVQGAPLTGPTKRRFPVYLPPDYEKETTRDYPLIVLLAGWGGKAQKYLFRNEDSAFGEPTYETLDQMILREEMPPVIVAAPDGTTKLGCSQYVNSAANGNFMDYMADEIVDLVSDQFRVRKGADYCGVIGHSSGGFGALLMGMKRPDRFGAVLSSAGDSFFEASILPQIMPTVIELEKAGGLELFLKKVETEPHLFLTSKAKFDCLLTLCLASCYAPNAEQGPLFGDLFFDLKTGEIIPEIWEKFLSFDPVRLVDTHLDKLKKLKLLRLECGREDEHALQLGHRQIAKKLEGAKINYEFEEYPGRHGGHGWRYPNRIQRVAEVLSQ